MVSQMIFKFPKKKIVLDCFTDEIYAIKYAPIHYAIKHIPEWWRNLPTSYSDVSQTNMRYCVGMIDYYRRSVAIPLWSDVSITVGANKSLMWQFSDNTTVAVHHPKLQYNGFLEDFTHMKIESPWFFQSEKNIDWVWSHPTYNYVHHDDAVSLPGISNFYYQHAVQINLFVRADREKHILIPQGQPMAVLTPMSDRRVEIVRHLVDKNELRNLQRKAIPISFKAKYKTAVDRLSKFSDCPFNEQHK